MSAADILMLSPKNTNKCNSLNKTLVFDVKTVFSAMCDPLLISPLDSSKNPMGNLLLPLMVSSNSFSHQRTPLSHRSKVIAGENCAVTFNLPSSLYTAVPVIGVN